MTDTAAVLLDGIEKRYGQTRAVDGAGLALFPGRVHAVVGENGAGKSTLLKIAGGVIAPDRGRVLVLDRELRPATPREAIRRGVAMVHQHFMLVPTLTGLENLALGEEPTRLGMLHLSPLAADVERLARSLRLEVPLDVPVARLSIGERQRLELLRALRHAPKVLILDEPTAVLAPAEARAVLGLARDLATRGVAVALVTHHLDEVAEFADEVTVLRRGKVVAHHPPGDPAIGDVGRLACEAVGEEPPVVARHARRGVAREPHVRHERVRLRVDDLHVDPGEAGAGSPLRGVSIELAQGEVVGVAGVEGNGQHALELALSGVLPSRRGTIALDGADVTRVTIADRRRRGLAWIPSDRHAHGIADELPARDVLLLGAFDEAARRGVVDDAELDRSFAGAVKALDLRPDAPELAAGSFSGGNQQKLVIARELRASREGRAALVLAAHPTRGVDVRAAATIRRSLVDAARDGAAVLVISSDLDELRDICDRIVVLRGGAVVATLPPDTPVSVIGEAMLG
ncbi:MAG: ATP-binding cassette domain-containing protein [Deltaproteobacteria bacterium]|nr:ATP-binding cassette domain-containing protein [Deltaproteobacteria bacterium]